MDSGSGLPESTGKTREAGISTGIDRRTFMTASAGLAAACASAPWTPPTPVSFRTIEHQPIPMPDGVNLSARLWLPETAARVPAVLECVPYRKRDLYRFADDLWGPQLAANGIAFIRLDVRGSGESEGVITDEYSEAELNDCEEAIAWLAKQDWCNGAVGMRGISWGGINALQVAARRPPALKAIMPMGSCGRRYTDDAHYIGGGLGHTNFQWGALFKKVMAGPPDPLIHGERWLDLWRQRLDATPPILATWLQHQREDAYWKRGSVAEAPRDIAIPAYFVSGWSDTYATPSLHLFSSLKTPAKILIGPWGHTYPYTASQGLDWAQEEVRWWRYWLMQEDTGIMREPRVRAFLIETLNDKTGSAPGAYSGHWIASEYWPPRNQPVTFHLNGGELGGTPKTGPALIHRDNGGVGATRSEWLDRHPTEQSHDDARSTVFDTAPLATRMDLTGSGELKLRIAADKPVAKIFVRLNEVSFDGKSWPVTWAALNLTRRDSMSAPTPLAPGEVYDVTIKLRPAAYVFLPGSRIRLAISESFWPMLWPSPEAPALTLPTGVSTLTLPMRAKTTDAPFGDHSPPLWTCGLLQPDPGDDLNHYMTVLPSDDIVEAAANIELSSSGEETSELTAGDPLSARWRQTTRSSWKRDGWACAVEASYNLTSDATHFHIVETLTATHNGAEIFTRSNEARIARDLL